MQKILRIIENERSTSLIECHSYLQRHISIGRIAESERDNPLAASVIICRTYVHPRQAKFAIMILRKSFEVRLAIPVVFLQIVMQTVTSVIFHIILDTNGQTSALIIKPCPEDCIGYAIVMAETTDRHRVEWLGDVFIYPVNKLSTIYFLPKYQLLHHLNAKFAILHFKPPPWNNPVQVFASDSP